MNLGSRISWVKRSFFGFLFVGLSNSAVAETCPPVLQADSKMLSELKVKSVAMNGKLTSNETPFNLESHKGKVTVFRLYGTWCPYCKRDIQSLNTKFGKLVKDKKLDMVLVSFQSRKESDESIELFLNHGAQELGVEKSNFRWLHSGLKGSDLKELRTKEKESLFPDFMGVPYGLVFDAKGRLRFRGHFTGEEKMQEKHYDMISSLATGKCS